MNTSSIRSGQAFILWLVFCTACITDYSTPPSDQQIGRLVVEGFITGHAGVDFRLSRTVALEADTAFLPETGAQVNILRSDGAMYGPARETELGVYRIEMGELNRDSEYCLQFVTQGDTYQSEFLAPSPTPPIDSLHWYKEEAGKPVNIAVSTHDDTRKTHFYLWTFEENWEFTANYFTRWFYDPEADDFYYQEYNPGYFCWNKDHSKRISIASTEKLAENRIVNQVIHTLPCTDTKLSLLYCITVSQRGLSSKGYTYYRNKQKMNEETGGLFSPQPSELKGNIRCITRPEIPVIGFIEVGEVSKKRMFIDGDKVYEYPEERKCTEYPREQLGPDITVYQMYRLGYLPYMVPDDPLWPSPLFFVEKKCLDCRETGTKNKPDFWPNEDI